MRTNKSKRMAPAPIAAALRAAADDKVVHAEFLADGTFDTGSLDLGSGVTLRATRNRLRMIVNKLPDTLVYALPGRHVTAVVDHPWLADERLIILEITEEDERLSIVLGESHSSVSAEQG